MSDRRLDPEQRRALLRWARLAVAAHLDGEPLSVPEEACLDGVEARCGAFVTLKRGGQLRGCIGHLQASGRLVETVAECAVKAATADPRFPPVEPAELAGLRFDISVLSPPEPTTAADIVPGVHGVVLRVKGRSAVFLPQVATEYGWDRETLLRHLSAKAGLEQEAWRRPEARFERFTAEVFGEEG